MNRFDGPFYISHGDLWKRNSDSLIAPSFRSDTHVSSGSEEIGVCYDVTNGALHHIGSAATASRWSETRTRKLRDAGFVEEAEALVVVSFPIHEETVAEINACLAITGRVLRLEDRLREIGERVGPVTRYPTFG